MEGIKASNKKHFNTIKYDLSKIDNEECYFCKFNDIVERHHIIPKSIGGTDEPNNFIFLCPNHHKLIHIKKYFLRLCEGVYLLTRSNNLNDNLFPYNYKTKVKREKPHLSILNAQRHGFLKEDDSGKIKLTKKNIESLKWMTIDKKKTKKVSYEKGV